MTRSMHRSVLILVVSLAGGCGYGTTDGGSRGVGDPVDDGRGAGDGDADRDPDSVDLGPGDDEPPIPDDPADPGGALDSCEACVDESCGQQWQACEQDAECVALDECGAACQDDACYEQCDQSHPTGVEPLMAFYQCLDAQCADPCGGADPGDQDPGDQDPGDQDPGADPDQAACEQCARASCGAGIDACEQDADCTALLGCYDGCGEQDENCWIGCETDHPTGTDLYFAFLDCLSTSCNAPCGF